MPWKHTIETIINNCENTHGDFFDYSEVVFDKHNTIHDKIFIICPLHGGFWQRASDHIRGSTCPECAKINRKLKQRKSGKKFAEESNIIHDNSFIYFPKEYVNDMTKIPIKCRIHGIFYQRPNDHLNGHGCPQCAIEQSVLNRLMDYNEFINRANDIHDLKYKYGEYKGFHRKMEIECPIHGIFLQTPCSHLNGRGCPICKESKGERKIRKYLNSHNIIFESQFKFEDCKYKNTLSFDFFIKDFNLLIEYDGEQHFFPKDYFGGEKEFLKTQKRDLIKNDYAKENNINLLRISYKDFYKINEILNENIK